MALKKFMERAEREFHVFFIIASGLSIRRAFYKKKIISGMCPKRLEMLRMFD